jgi:hypothetical protein
MSKLQLLTTKFENLKMDEDETISEFNAMLRDIGNSSFALGEKMSEKKLARKILRSLPKRFSMKVTAIEESQDLSSIKVDELIGSLQTFEMSFDDKPKKKLKNLAFTSEESPSEDHLSEAIALISKKFNKSLNKIQARWKTNVPDKTSNIRSQGKPKEDNNSELDKEVRCFECEGFGLIKSECLTFLKKQKKGMTITLYDSEEESEGETTNKAFSGLLETTSDSSSEDLLDEDLAEAHKPLTAKWRQSCQIIERREKLIDKLAKEKEALSSTATGLKEEVTLWESKLTNMIKSVRMLNKGTDMLE